MVDQTIVRSAGGDRRQPRSAATIWWTEQRIVAVAIVSWVRTD
jgi:hypothetical protein